MTPFTPFPAVDFADIRSSCPKAYAALEKWTNAAGVSTRQRSIFYKHEGIDYVRECQLPTNPRDLFDFFDQQGVYVTVEKCYAFWKWTIWNESGYPLRWSNDLAGYPTRAAAEAAAFTAGFAKLEEMLNQKEG